MNFIFLKENAYSKESCNQLIDWFEKNLHLASKGKAGEKDLDNLEIPLELTSSQSFGNLGLSLQEAVNQFKKEYPLFDKKLCMWSLDPFCQLCRFLPNKYYNHIHCEQDGTKEYLNRVFAWMIYLNDIDEGGETEFLQHKFKTNPKAGNLYIWPAGLTHMHRGVPCNENKYFITGWFSYK